LIARFFLFFFFFSFYYTQHVKQRNWSN
jgi:hypothetical protein